MQYFTYKEFFTSISYTQVAHELYEKEKDNLIFLNRIKKLCFECLDPMASFFELPVKITSGIRDLKLNALVGGEPTSDHLKALACDFVVQGASMSMVYEWMKANTCYRQLIFYPKKKFIHCSINDFDAKKIYKHEAFTK